MADTLYVNKPGGVIVHFNDGTSHSLEYGDEVPQDQLAEYVDAKSFADGEKRKESHAELQALDASRRAALDEAGQVNSSSSPVPGNYSELDEDAAALFVSNLARFPEQQAAVIQHELLFGGGRKKVVDAASDYAREAAGIRNDALSDNTTGNQGESLLDQPGVVPAPDPFRGGAGADEQAKTEQIVQAANEQVKALKGGKATPPPSGTDEGGDEQQHTRQTARNRTKS